MLHCWNMFFNSQEKCGLAVVRANIAFVSCMARDCLRLYRPNFLRKQRERKIPYPALGLSESRLLHR